MTFISGKYFPDIFLKTFLKIYPNFCFLKFYLNSPFSKFIFVNVDGVDFGAVGGVLLIVGADHDEGTDDSGSHTDLSDLVTVRFVLKEFLGFFVYVRNFREFLDVFK